MMKKLALIIFNLFYLFSFSQSTTCFSVDTILPANPKATDTIQLVICTILPLPHVDCDNNIVEKHDSLFGNSLLVDTKFDFSPQSNLHGCARNDTLKIPPLSQGNFSLIHFWSFQDTLNGLFSTRVFVDTIRFTVLPATNIQEIPLEQLKISPNPASNLLSIQNLNKALINQIQIWDLSGRLVKEMMYESEEIDVSDLANGVYVLRVLTEKGSKEMKLVKQ